MKNTLHTYHPTSMQGRGVHAFTTTDEREARALFHAEALRDALSEILNHGEQLAEALYQAGFADQKHSEFMAAFVKAALVMKHVQPQEKKHHEQ